MYSHLRKHNTHSALTARLTTTNKLSQRLNQWLSFISKLKSTPLIEPQKAEKTTRHLTILEADMAQFLPDPPRAKAHLATLRGLNDRHVLKLLQHVADGVSPSEAEAAIEELRQRLGKARSGLRAAAEQLCRRVTHHWVTRDHVAGLLEELCCEDSYPKMVAGGKKGGKKGVKRGGKGSAMASVEDAFDVVMAVSKHAPSLLKGLGS